MAIDKAGLAVNGQHDGYQLLDKLGMSSTDFQQNVAMKRALEGELANQIQNIAGVSDATVNLAMPQQTLFLADQKQATASVLLTLSGGGFDDVAVRGVQRLVANAVTGLTPANVVITDQAGSLLSSSDGGIGDAAASKLATESSYSRQLESGAQQIIDQMLGAGAGLVSVNARLNLDSQTQKKITYGKTGVPLQKTAEKELLKGTGAGAAGAAGTTSNIPGYTGGTGAGGATNYTHTKGDQTNGVDQTVTDTTVAGGTPTNLFVAIAFAAPPVDAEGRLGDDAHAGRPDQGSARRREGGAGLPRHHAEGPDRRHRHLPDIGLERRGTRHLGLDRRLCVTSPPRASRRARAAGRSSMVTSHLREGAAVAGALLLLFLARRSLRRRQALLGSAEARWMPTLSAPPIPVDDIALPAGPNPHELEAANKKALQGRVEEIAGQRPSDVAQQLRGWLAEDS